jgi:Fe-S cluster assembly protein SufD
MFVSNLNSRSFGSGKRSDNLDLKLLSNNYFFLAKNTIEKRQNLHEKFYIKDTKTSKINLQMKSDDLNEQNKWADNILINSEDPSCSEIKLWREISKNLIKNSNLPSKKDESWRQYSLDDLYDIKFSFGQKTKIDSIIEEQLGKISGAKLVLIDGKLSPSLSNLKNLPDGVYFGSISEIDQEKISDLQEKLGRGETGIDGGYFSLLNLASISDINILLIPEGLKLEDPINLVNINIFAENTVANHRVIICAEKNSSFSLFETNISSPEGKFFDNSCISVFLEKNVKFDFTLVNKLSKTAFQIKSIFADLGQKAEFNLNNISLGGRICRINLGIELNGVESSTRVHGLFAAKNANVLDLHSRISHNFPNCYSKQLQKNLVFDSAQTVFAGKVQVQNGASGTNSDQLCKTLLLSEKARVDAIPILEINNEDVKCTHGATVSDLDDSQIFYIESRGISKDIAKKVLINGFAEEIVKEIPTNVATRVEENVTMFLEKY